MYCPKNDEQIRACYYCCNCEYFKNTYCQWEDNNEMPEVQKESNES